MRKNIFFIILILITATINSACIFPDKLPEFNKLKNYSPQIIEYGNTTLEKFKQITPNISNLDIENYTDGISIIKLEPALTDFYSLVRVGFKNNKLDWLEFKLAKDINISEFISIYGNPSNINSTYSKNLDYYNYTFFNISVDKNNKFAQCITYFSSAPVINISAKQKMKFFQKFSDLEPGITTESDFTAKFPGITPIIDNKTETSSVYVLQDELGNARYYYDKAILKFEHGILTWINLIPKNLPLNACLKTINTNYKKEKVNSDYDIYDFSKFILVIDSKTKMVKSIGVFSKDNRI